MRVLTHRKTRGKRNRTRHEINAEREKIHVVKGDTVRITETRPLSKDKRWRVVEIVDRAR